MQKKGKTFIFPENVESGYNLIKNVTVKTFFVLGLPFIIAAVVVLVIPPYTVYFLIAKAFIACLLITIGWALAASRPVKTRQNITVLQHLRYLKDYSIRQKLFYIDRKNRK